MMKKRLLSLLTAFVMTLSLLPANVRATAVEGTDYTYEGGVLTIKTENFDPAAFAQRASVTTVRIYDGLMEAKASRTRLEGKFTEYTSLSSFAIEGDYPNVPSMYKYSCMDGVLFIDSGAILLCYPQAKPGTSYVMPDSVTLIADNAFHGTDVTIYAKAEVKQAIIANHDALFAADPPEMQVYSTPLTGISVAPQALTLELGESEDLVLTLDPANASVGTCRWASSAPNVASVDQTGHVVALSLGSTTVTVTSDDGGYTATCAVTVTEIPVSSISVPEGTPGADGENVAIDREEAAYTTLSVEINDATDKTVTWTVSDSSVATLRAANGAGGSSRGTLSGPPLSAPAGEPKTITVTAADDGSGRFVSAVEVVPHASGTVTVTATAGNQSHSFTLDLTQWVTSASLDASPVYLSTLAANGPQTKQLTLTQDGENPAVTWTSDNEDVATVDENGLVTAVAAGSATIAVAVTSGSGARTHTENASCTVLVRSIALDEPALELMPEDTGTLTATIAPAASETVDWTSSNGTVATVDQNGVVTAHAVGTATVRATMHDCGFYAECAVTVTDRPVTGLTLDKSNITLSLNAPGEPAATTQLTATLEPTNATNTTLHWSSTNESVVTVGSDETTVNAQGKSTVTLTMHAEGAADIVVTAANGAKQAVCHVLVPIKTTGLAFNTATLSLGPNGVGELIPIFTPNNPTDRSLTWSSTDETLVTVAEVNGRGVVTVNPALTFTANAAPRTATITATTRDGSGMTASCVVTVQRNLVTGVDLDQHELSLNLTDNTSAALTATIAPANATVTGLSWISGDESVATVSAAGVVTAKGVGNTIITVVTEDGGYSSTCAVTVAPTRVSEIALTPTTLNLNLTDTKTGTLTAELTPHNATDRAVRWTSSDETVATVSDAATTAASNTGTTTITVTAVGAGSATIRAVTHDGSIVAECTVNVAAVPVDSIELSGEGLVGSDLTLTLSSSESTPDTRTATLTATVKPLNATIRGVSWISGDESIVTVVNGVVTAHKSGTTTVTALSADGVNKAVCNVTVYWLTTGVEMNKEETTIVKGATERLTATVQPNANEHTLTWTSSNTSIATVDENGVVTAVATGTATITAADDRSSAKATCVVTVILPASGVTLSSEGFTLAVGNTHSLTATVAPAGSTDAVEWSSSDESVATVAADGTVTAVAGGSAVITAKAGTCTATCTVTVPKGVTGVELNKTALSLGIGETETLIPAFTPYDATDRAVSWSVEQEDDYISIDAETGFITALKVKDATTPGTATVTVTTHDGAHTASCVVTVELTAATGVTLGGADLADGRLTLNMTTKTSSTLTATVTPGDASNKNVTWTSGDESVVTVENGVVTAVKPGTALVTVTTVSGSHSASCLVTVEKTPVTSIALSAAELSAGVLTLSVTDPEHVSAEVTATINPTNATNRKLLWTVDDPSVAELSVYETTAAANGAASLRVTARKAGTTTVTATAADDPTVQATFTVTIPETPVTNLAVSPTTVELTVGGTQSAATENLTVTVTPIDATNKALNWISSDTGVVTVEALTATTAVIRGVAAGTATITVTPQDGSGVSAVCTVTVVVPITGVTISKTSATLTIGSNETETLTASVTPSGAKQDITWTSSDETVATVDEHGVVTALKAGVATISATATGTAYHADCAVTVIQPTGSVTVTPASNSLIINGAANADKVTLSATLTPSNSSASVTWSSNNEAVATVDANGVVTAHAKGTATITATTSDGKTGTASVTVTVLATGVTLNTSTLSLEQGKTAQLTATVAPAGVSDDTVTWTSDDEDIATVDANGVVTAVAASGSATVTATTANGKTATCTVTVKPIAVTGFATKPADASIARGEIGTLTASVAPANAANRVINWSSGNESVARVQSVSLDPETGVSTATIEAVAVGSATITAQTADGSFVARCVVTVPSVAAGNISLSDASLTLYRNIPAGSGDMESTHTLRATVTPGGVTDGVTWLSTDTGVATVDQNGVVTAVSGGAATIVATVGTRSAQCTVTVNVLASDLTISKSTLSVQAHQAAVLTASVPEGTTNTVLSWSSSDETVALVNGGTITALKAGTTTVTVATTDGSGKSKTCEVTVTAPSVTGVSLTPTVLTMYAGDECTLLAAITPADAGDTALSWVSTNPAAATVDANGKVTAVSANANGTAASATIRVTTHDGSKTAECVVTVQPTAVTQIVGLPATLNITFRNEEERTQQLTATAKPDNATNKNLVWSSSDSSVVTIDQSGNIEALKPGSAVISVHSESNGTVIATCSVSVNATNVTSVSVAPGQLDLYPGQQSTITASVLPAAADDKRVNWSSSNETVATVDADGNVTACGTGYAVITATTVDQGKTATCVVHVWTMVTGVTLNKDTLGLAVGASETLIATVAPEGAVNKHLIWTSGSNAVATVDAAGRVTGVGEGTTTITATSEENGDFHAECTVTVSKIAVTSVSVSQETLTLTVGGSKTLTAAVSPANATDSAVTWSSGTLAVATVNAATGEITAVAPGTATITASAGGESASCTVTVYAAAERLTIKRGDDPVATLTLTLGSNPTATLSATVLPGEGVSGDAEQGVTWYSSNSDVAEVGANGAVTAKKGGTAVITATSKANPAVKNSCTVTVQSPTSSVSLTSASSAYDAETGLSFDLSSTTVKYAELTATILPAGSTDAVAWSIDDPTVAQLSAAATANGVSTVTVYPLKSGTASITVTSGGKSKTCDVTVVYSPTGGVLLDQASLTITAGGTATLHATVLPVGADNVTVHWASGSNAVATVDQNGVVTAVAAGSTTVTASVTVSGNEYSRTCAVTVTPILVSNIAMAESMSITVGELEGALPTATVTPNTANQTLNWASSNTSVATVVGGKIQALAVGTALLTATAADGSGISASCLLTVEPVALTGISLGDGTIRLAEGATSDALTVTYTPANATEKAVFWRSSNVSVATVDEHGVVTAVAAGTAIITAASSADASISASRTVVVTAAVERVSLSRTTLTIPAGGDSVALVATLSPANASNPTVTWESDAEGVATVDENGVVTPVAAGTAHITATTADGGKTATCTVTVTQPVTGVRLDRTELSLVAGGATATLTATVDPALATEKGVSWSSTNTAAATVAGGIVTPVAAGTAVIVVTTTDGGKAAYCTVTVTQPVTGVSLDRSTLSLAVGSRDVLTASVTGGAVGGGVDWSSSDESIATVSDSGIVTAVAAGEVTITAASSENDSFSARCTVTVYAPVTAATIKRAGEEDALLSLALNMVTEPTAELACTVTAAGVTPTITWSSSNTGVAIVDNNGHVTAIGKGSATITATASAGGQSVSADCAVTVSREPFRADRSALTLLPNTTGTVTFASCEEGTSIGWTGTNDGVVRMSFENTEGGRVYTFTPLKNGVVTLTWTKAADANYDAGTGSVTIVSLPEPLTAVTFGSLGQGCSLTAEIVGSVIRVAGYVTTAPASYDLSDKLNYTLALDVAGGLSTEWSGGEVVVKNNGTEICRYQIDRSGMVQLSEQVNVSASTMLMAPAGVVDPGAVELTSTTVSGLKEASVAAVLEKESLEGVSNVETVIEITPVAQTTDSRGNMSSVTMDITPHYTVTVTDEEGNVTEQREGTLDAISTSVLLSVKVRFRPTQIVHEHDGVLEYPAFECTGPDAEGYYTVTWRQSSFSRVSLLATPLSSTEEARVVISYPTEMTTVSAMPGSTLIFRAAAGVGSYTVFLVCYDANGMMLSVQTLPVTGNAASLGDFVPPVGTALVRIFALAADGTPLSAVLTIPAEA